MPLKYKIFLSRFSAFLKIYVLKPLPVHLEKSEMSRPQEVLMEGPPGTGPRALTLLSSPLPGAGGRMKPVGNPIKQLVSRHTCDHGVSTLGSAPTLLPSALQHALESGSEIQAALSVYAK